MSNTTVYLDDYKPTNFTISTVDLEFDIFDDEVIVTNSMHILRRDLGDLCLAGEDLTLMDIYLNNNKLSKDEYVINNNNLTIKNCPNNFKLKISTKIHPKNNTQLMGLYYANSLFSTQCEAEGFRRITYHYDRPDVLSKYTTKISADKTKCPVLLSNGNLISEGDLENNRHWALWEDPFKKPSYLFALVAGQLSFIEDKFITKSQREVKLKIYLEEKNLNKCAHAMNSLKNAMRWDEDVYGLEYDLDIFMIVAVNDFNMGAMENKGLNIFNAKYILANPSTATDTDYMNIEGVVAHEYFHNWTGNRVTCRDWFQLSLKEGLTVFRDQEFSRDMNSRDVLRIKDVKVLRANQFPEDSSPLAHPVRPSSYQAINNFYTTTIYNKGAEVIRMQHTILGKDGFRKGIDLYFDRFDGKAVTINDFVQAMQDANNIDLTQFKNWYSQARTPVVTVSSNYKDNCLTLNFTQTCEKSPECSDKKPFHIPIKIALFDSNGNKIQIDNELLEIHEFKQSFSFNNLTEKPTISLLRDFSAPIILKQKFDPENLLAILRYETDGFAKWDAAEQLKMSVLINLYNSKHEDFSIPSELINVYKEVLLDENLDKGLKAEILTPQTFTNLASEVPLIDVDKAMAALDYFVKTIGKNLFDDLKNVYETLWATEDNSMSNKVYGARKLRNISLTILAKSEPEKILSICQNQFMKASTMTDKLASLTILSNSQNIEVRNKALTEFYQEWQNDELVLDKWFTIQAISEAPDVLNNIKNLLNHKNFHIKNPNKVHALISAFTNNNPKYFHNLDGSGYKFLTDIIIELDKLNPQLSSRIASPFAKWQSYCKTRQSLIKTELLKLNNMTLSKDLTELVSKSLQ